MNDLMIFKNDEFGQIRSIEINNEPYFIGKDIAIALGYERTDKETPDVCHYLSPGCR